MKCIYALLFLLIFIDVSGQNKKLSVIGSSTSACTGPSSFATCYLGRLDAYYDGIGQPIDIFQLAVGGYTVYKGMPSSFTGPWPNLQPDINNNITKALSFNPNVVLVNYPSNGYDTLRVDSIMRCYRTIRDSANALGKPCFITTTQPRHAFPFNNLTVRQKLKELRDSIMLQFGYFAIDFWTGIADPTTYEILPAYNSGDNIHLNDAGHDILFTRVRDKNIFGVVLPVKLVSFNAATQQDMISISWSVADETAGTSYEIQRSGDAINFETVKTITAGANAASRKYESFDKSPAGITYYRLKVTENGKVFYSAIVKVVSGKGTLSFNSLTVDPLSNQLVMKLTAAENSRVNINFINNIGMRLSSSTLVLHPGTNRLIFPLHDFPAGTYWTQCIADDKQVFTKGFSRF
ncbi:MAG TPA: SGNH/GDSL hydrolase family protein [Chitinophagaceae bacterium]